MSDLSAISAIGARGRTGHLLLFAVANLGLKKTNRPANCAGRVVLVYGVASWNRIAVDP
jgi:hypothetical protein